MLAGHTGARLLGALGVQQVSGVAGESFLPLLEGLRREGIPFVNTAHESGAVFLALGLARATGVPGVAAVTRGPGAANALIGVYEAMKSATPLILIVGQIDTHLRHRDGIQEMEIVDTFRQTAKAAVEVTRADRFAPSLLAAFRKSREGRPGPIVLSVPSDHLYGEAPPLEVPDVLTRPVLDREISLGGSELGRVNDALRSAERVLMILGPEFRHYRHAKLVSTVAEAGGFGVLGAHSCLDVIEHDNPQWLGCSTVRASGHIASAISEADVILGLGTGFGDQTSRNFTQTGARMFAVSTQSTAIWDEYLDAEHLVADPVSVLEGLGEQAETEPGVIESRRTWVTDLQRRMSEERDLVRQADGDGIEGRVPMSLVVEALDRALPASSLLVSDVGTFNDWFTRYLPFGGGRRYIGPTSNPMGFALPTAIGAHLGSTPDRTVVLAGDGGFLMTAMEMATLRRLGLPMTVVVFNNGVWGSIARDQDNTYGVRYGTELDALPDFALLSQSFGIEGRSIDDPQQLDETLTWAFDGDDPKLLAVATDPRRLSPADLAESRS